jgi:hypothetical protein
VVAQGNAARWRRRGESCGDIEGFEQARLWIASTTAFDVFAGFVLSVFTLAAFGELAATGPRSWISPRRCSAGLLSAATFAQTLRALRADTLES